MQSIYLHIPYCSRICTYCAFNTYEGMEETIASYVDALIREIRFSGSSQPDLRIHTIYFGGGTPSLLSLRQMKDVMSALQASFALMPASEITLEANPNDLTPAYAEGLFQLGINRLSIGMQSADDDELRVYGREHTHDTTIRAVALARAAGFSNISVDLMFGNPGQTIIGWQKTLEAALALETDHISLYGLEVKGGTLLNQQVKSGLLEIPPEDATAAMYEMAMQRLTSAGMRHYEISNWGHAGCESQHNQQYWRNLPYLGLGAGAHGYAASQRTIVIRAPQRYITAMHSQESVRLFPRTPATSKCTAVSAEDEIAETIMLGLRMTAEGIQRQAFRERFGVELTELKHAELSRLQTLDLIEITPECVRLSPKGYLLSNPIIAAII